MAKKTTAKGKSTKRKISGSKGKVTARKNKQTDPRGVIGLFVLCIGILALVCQFVSSSGNLLNYCKYFVRGMGGTLCLLLPLVIICVGAALVFFKENRVSIRTIVCISVIFLLVEGFLQLFAVNNIVATLRADGKAINYGTFLARAYSFSSYECTGGGLIGALIAWPLFCALDVWGSVIFLLCAILVSLMVLTGMSFSSVGMSLSEWIDDLRVEISERREEREAMRAMEEESSSSSSRSAPSSRKRSAKSARKSSAGSRRLRPPLQSRRWTASPSRRRRKMPGRRRTMCRRSPRSSRQLRRSACLRLRRRAICTSSATTNSSGITSRIAPSTATGCR